MSEPHASTAGLAAYRPYWIAWLILLGITLVMLFVHQPALLLAGVALKASIICLWYMHLRSERSGLVACIAVGLFANALFLFLLMVPDARAM